MPNYEGNITRSLYLFQDELEKFIEVHSVNNIVSYKEYLSFTNGERYNDISQVEIIIANSKKGKDISKYNSAEKEVLYQRNSKFKVVDKYMEDDVHYIVLEEDDEK